MTCPALTLNAVRQLLNLLDKSDYNLNQTGYFIENDKTKEIIDQLRDDDASTLLLTALSGMGKSKLIYEAFKETEREPNRYYTKFNGNRDKLMGELKQILKDNPESDGIIIVDDCPMDHHLQLPAGDRLSEGTENHALLQRRFYVRGLPAQPGDFSGV